MSGFLPDRSIHAVYLKIQTYTVVSASAVTGSGFMLSIRLLYYWYSAPHHPVLGTKYASIS